MERDLKTQELRGIDCQRVYDNCKRETERCRGELASAKEAAEQVAVITAELQEMFRGMPETVVEVEDAINEAVAEANAVLCNNPNVLEEYERRCKQVSCTFFLIFSVIDPNFSALLCATLRGLSLTVFCIVDV
jgi:uncharacterized hydantoinase/oxoprolinase family protein